MPAQESNRMRRSEAPFPLPPRVQPKGGTLYDTHSEYVAGKRRVVWTRLCAIDEGEAALYRALSALRGGTEGPDMPRHIEAFRQHYLPTLGSVAMQKDAGRMLDRITKAFRDFHVEQVRPSDVEDFVDGFGAHRASARGHKAILSTFFKWCVLRRNLRTDNPCREVTVRRGPRRPMVWTPTVFHRIRDALGTTDEAEMMRCYIDLSFLIYQRTTDVRMLERKNVEATSLVVRPTKTRRSSGVEIEIRVTPAIRAVLDRAAAIGKRWKVVCPYVIHTRQGTAYTRSGIYSAFRKAGLATGIKGADPKSLRNFAASEAKKRGATMDDLQDALGHTNVATTQGYVRRATRVVSTVELALPERPEPANC